MNGFHLWFVARATFILEMCSNNLAQHFIHIMAFLPVVGEALYGTISALATPVVEGFIVSAEEWLGVGAADIAYANPYVNPAYATFEAEQIAMQAAEDAAWESEFGFGPLEIPPGGYDAGIPVSNTGVIREYIGETARELFTGLPGTVARAGRKALPAIVAGAVVDGARRFVFGGWHDPTVPPTPPTPQKPVMDDLPNITPQRKSNRSSPKGISPNKRVKRSFEQSSVYNGSYKAQGFTNKRNSGSHNFTNKKKSWQSRTKARRSHPRRKFRSSRK